MTTTATNAWEGTDYTAITFQKRNIYQRFRDGLDELYGRSPAETYTAKKVTLISNIKENKIWITSLSSRSYNHHKWITKTLPDIESKVVDCSKQGRTHCYLHFLYYLSIK